VRVLAQRPDWRAVSLATPSGVPLFSPATPIDKPPPKIVERGSLEEVVRVRAPVVGPLTRGRSPTSTQVH
jgi:hypothetical protein